MIDILLRRMTEVSKENVHSFLKRRERGYCFLRKVDAIPDTNGWGGAGGGHFSFSEIDTRFPSFEIQWSVVVICTLCTRFSLKRIDAQFSFRESLVSK